MMHNDNVVLFSPKKHNVNYLSLLKNNTIYSQLNKIAETH